MYGVQEKESISVFSFDTSLFQSQNNIVVKSQMCGILQQYITP